MRYYFITAYAVGSVTGKAFRHYLSARGGSSIGGGHMASAEREPIMGVWGLCPQRGPGAEPLVRGLGAKPPEAERFLVLSYV